jgi:hypothetical protein
MRLEYLSLALMALGLASLWLGLRGLGRRRLARGLFSGALGLGLLALAAAVFLAASNLHTYARLTHETAAGEIRFTKEGADRYRVMLVLAAQDSDTPASSQYFVLQGQEWQLDARIIKWHGLGNLLGLDTLYRMERLSGRYSSIDQERSQPRAVHSLTENPGLDVWDLGQRYGRWLRLVDASYGSATYLPMADGAIYTLHISQSGLLARPANEQARDAVGQWR